MVWLVAMLVKRLGYNESGSAVSYHSRIVSQQDRITAGSYQKGITMNQDQRGRICGDKVGGC